MVSDMPQGKKLKFFLGGQDGGMERIEELLAVTGTPFVNQKLSHQEADVERYHADIQQAINEGFVPVLVELNNQSGIDLPKDCLTVDHRFNHSHKKATVLQVIDMLGLEATRYDQLIAANEKAGPRGLVIAGASDEEINAIRSKDHKAQGLGAEDAARARASLANTKFVGNIAVVRPEEFKLWPFIVDDLHFKQTQHNILILPENGPALYFGHPDFVDAIYAQYPREKYGSWEGGESQSDPKRKGFCGVPIEDKEKLLEFVSGLEKNRLQSGKALTTNEYLAIALQKGIEEIPAQERKAVIKHYAQSLVEMSKSVLGTDEVPEEFLRSARERLGVNTDEWKPLAALMSSKKNAVYDATNANPLLSESDLSSKVPAYMSSLFKAKVMGRADDGSVETASWFNYSADHIHDVVFISPDTKEVTASKKVNQFEEIEGIMARNEVAGHLRNEIGLAGVKADDVVIGSGVTGLLSSAFEQIATVEGDTVLVPEVSYTLLNGIIAGGHASFAQIDSDSKDHRGIFSADKLKTSIEAARAGMVENFKQAHPEFAAETYAELRTEVEKYNQSAATPLEIPDVKAIRIETIVNPTGEMWSKEQVRELARVLLEDKQQNGGGRYPDCG